MSEMNPWSVTLKSRSNLRSRIGFEEREWTIWWVEMRVSLMLLILDWSLIGDLDVCAGVENAERHDAPVETWSGWRYGCQTIGQVRLLPHLPKVAWRICGCEAKNSDRAPWLIEVWKDCRFGNLNPRRSLAGVYSGNSRVSSEICGTTCKLRRNLMKGGGF